MAVNVPFNPTATIGCKIGSKSLDCTFVFCTAFPVMAVIPGLPGLFQCWLHSFALEKLAVCSFIDGRFYVERTAWCSAAVGCLRVLSVSEARQSLEWPSRGFENLT